MENMKDNFRGEGGKGEKGEGGEGGRGRRGKGDSIGDTPQMRIWRMSLISPKGRQN